jgi:hypothetical protein
MVMVTQELTFHWTPCHLVGNRQQSGAGTGRTATGSVFPTRRNCHTKCRAVPKSPAPTIQHFLNQFQIYQYLKSYILLEGSVNEMLVHEMRSGEQRFKIVVADPEGDRQSNGRPQGVPSKNSLVLKWFLYFLVQFTCRQPNPKMRTCCSRQCRIPSPWCGWSTGPRSAAPLWRAEKYTI